VGLPSPAAAGGLHRTDHRRVGWWHHRLDNARVEGVGDQSPADLLPAPRCLHRGRFASDCRCFLVRMERAGQLLRLDDRRAPGATSRVDLSAAQSGLRGHRRCYCGDACSGGPLHGQSRRGDPAAGRFLRWVDKQLDCRAFQGNPGIYGLVMPRGYGEGVSMLCRMAAVKAQSVRTGVSADECTSSPSSPPSVRHASRMSAYSVGLPKKKLSWFNLASA
jgi:hypothetical protein